MRSVIKDLFIAVFIFSSSCATLPESSRLPARESDTKLVPGGAARVEKSSQERSSAPTIRDLEPTAPKFLLASVGADSEIVELSAFAVSYNKTTGLAQWVSYCMDYEMAAAEAVERSDKFRIYPDLQDKSSHPKWYTNSGYDRGHLAPAGDFRHSALAMSETFFMINIAPQAPRLNRGLWRSLEGKIRDLTRGADLVCVFTGPVLDGEKTTLPQQAAIPIPKAFFKVIYARKGSENLGIGFLVPNHDQVVDLDNYDLPIRKLEHAVQIDFFVEMTRELQDDIELDEEPSFVLEPTWEN